MVIKTDLKCTHQINNNGKLISCGKCLNCRRAYIEFLQKNVKNDKKEAQQQ